MANHVIRDRIWESQKLRRCSREAALAYPWIFLVADDWGRFEYNPRRIWSRVFGGREDVTVTEVSAWLSEYEREGLLVPYSNSELAVWYRFEGRPPSKRRPSLYPDPKAVKRVPKRKRSGTRPVPDRYPLADQESRDRSDQESRAGSEIAPAAADAPPGSLAPVEKSWSQEACDIWAEHMGSIEAIGGGRIGHALKPLLAKHGWGTVRELWQRACAQAASEVDPEYFTPEVFARTFKARMTAVTPRSRGRPSVGEQALAAAAEFIGGKGGKG